MLKVIEGGFEPVRSTKYSACVDLYASEDVTIGAGETKLIPLGVCIDLEKFRKLVFRNLDSSVSYYPKENQDKIFNSWLSSHYLQLMLRSSLSKELVIANGVGIIDLDYKDEIMVRVHKPNGRPFLDFFTKILGWGFLRKTFIKKGQRVAQITLLEHKSYLFGIESEEERTGGFGSSGKR